MIAIAKKMQCNVFSNVIFKCTNCFKLSKINCKGLLGSDVGYFTNNTLQSFSSRVLVWVYRDSVYHLESMEVRLVDHMENMGMCLYFFDLNNFCIGFVVKQKRFKGYLFRYNRMFYK